MRSPWPFDIAAWPVVLLFSALTLLTVPVSAQVNTERMRNLDVEGFSATLGGSVALQSGNTELLEVGVDTRMDLLYAPHHLFLVSEVRYGQSDGRRFRDRSFAHLRYNYRFGGPLVAEAFTQVERDNFALLELRTLAGGGLRLRLLDSEPARLFAGFTPMFESERLDPNRVGTHPARTATVRLSHYANARLRVNERTFLLSTTYAQPRIDAFGDIRLLNETRLGVGITRALALRVSLNVRYDSRPPGDVSDWTLSLTNGLTVSL
ncbi:MAG: DUF481 domain-containing protein [Longimonas sp.]|uniref:DUF481 domain-containing protein n=1 Tax=Longimonas sp. TaxID=2039626 RepID=UPI0033634C7C